MWKDFKYRINLYVHNQQKNDIQQYWSQICHPFYFLFQHFLKIFWRDNYFTSVATGDFKIEEILRRFITESKLSV